MAIRSITFKSVLKGIAARTGQLLGDVLEDTVLTWFAYIDDRTRQGWEDGFFDQLTVTEKRYFREGFWLAGTYQANDIVYYEPENKYYINSSGGTTVEEPFVGGSDWVETDDFAYYIPWEQRGQTPIDQPNRMYECDPEKDPYSGTMDFETIKQGVLPLDTTGDAFVYLNFRERVLDMGDLVIFDDTEVYVSGDVIYFDPVDNTATATPDLYVANTTTTAGESPETTPASWDIWYFPYVLGPFVKRAAFSDHLIAENEQKRADRELNRAISILEDEISKEVIQSGQSSTYAGNRR